MKIHNVRLGLATNSSSTHSIIILPGGAADADADGTFGWEHFTAGSRGAKRHYLALMVFYALQQQCGAEIARTVAQAWTGKLPSEDDYIDHQSVIALPHAWDGKGVDKEFFEDFKAFLLRDDVVVLGGNDNSGGDHPLKDRPGALDLNSYRNLPVEAAYLNFVARRDAGYWVMFSRATGTKLRFSFADNDLAFKPTKASAPELIDIKITDYCPFDCAYCYQDSTTRGRHAPKEALRSLAWACGDLKVFEVALGGGEPTMHPEFEDVLRDFRYHGVVPNFTTKSTKWLKNSDTVRAVKEAGGAFAFSAEKGSDVRTFMDAAEAAGFKADYHGHEGRIHVQHVMGTVDRYEFNSIVRACAEHHVPLTLLGYKTVGRGKSLTAKKYDWWLDELQRLRKEEVYARVGIDTALAAESEAKLKAAGVHGALYETREGGFSMYVDAVAHQAGPSSYAPDAMRAFGNANDWDKQWRTSGEELARVFAAF